MEYLKRVEKWGTQEIRLVCEKEYDNPFTDCSISAVFKSKNETVSVDGFYDGNNVFVVRFMPSFEGEYTFEIHADFLNEILEGEFDAITPTENNHGPVRVADTYHLAYEDGTPYYSVGTTCYAWANQPMHIQEETLSELSKGYFNKMRFCVFPKHYEYNFRDPITFPYVGTPVDNSGINTRNFWDYNSCEGNDWDFYRFNPEHFQIFERRIQDLMALGIEADVIIMHPYDRWGFSQMSKEQDDLYIKYVVARFSAYRNVWWSLANEYDFMKNKTQEDWQRYADIICEKDPYKHMRSVHNGTKMYDFRRPWVTHCSVQRTDLYKSTEFGDEYRKAYGKPVVFDEIVYEGNINQGWGNISGQELVRRFWEGAMRGCYAGHGETYMHPENILWWSHGGKLYGDSPARIKFLHKILCQTPGLGLRNDQFDWDGVIGVPEKGTKDDYFIAYFGLGRVSFREYTFDDDIEREVEIIDTWNMTIENAGTFKRYVKVEMPGREYMAIRIKKTNI